MAMVEINKTKTICNDSTVIVNPTTLTAEGGFINFSGEDSKTLLIIGGATATIKAGNALQGTNDLIVPFVSGKTKAVVIESGKFINVSGINSGKVVILGSGATVQLIELT